MPLIFNARNDGTTENCASECTTDNEILGNELFNYEVGQMYEYDYVAETSTAMRGTSKQESRITIRARAKVTVRDKCDFVLEVRKHCVKKSVERLS